MLLNDVADRSDWSKTAKSKPIRVWGHITRLHPVLLLQSPIERTPDENAKRTAVSTF